MASCRAETRKTKLAVDYQTVQTTQKQDCIYLLNQLCYLSGAVRDIQAQRHHLFAQQQTLYEQQGILDPTLSQQQQALSQQISPLLKEYTTILGQLARLRQDK